MDASALPLPPPLDAEALEFLQDLVVDDDDDDGVDDSGHHSSSGSAVSLLLLPDQPPHQPLPATGPLGGVDDALALSPLDFFPLSDDESASSASSGATPSHATTKAAAHTTSAATTLKAKRKKPNRSPNYDPNRARNLRRHELVYLREKVAEMEHELARLRDAPALQLTAPRATPVALAPVPSRLPLVPVGGLGPVGGALEAAPSQQLSRAPGEAVWERIAARQLSERQRAERENERLKIVLETQLKIAKSLEHLLHKRTTMQGFDACGLGRQRRVFSCAPSASDTEAFQSLLEQVHACYLDADTHFENFGIGASEASCRDARIRDGVNPAAGDSGGFHMEIFANDVLPFPVHAAGKAAWHYFSHYKNHLPFRLYYERVSENMGLPEDTIVENSGLELQVNHTKAIFNLKQVIRRYVERDRVVIAYSAIAQPVEFASKPVWGFDFREWGCMVLQKPTTLDADAFSVLKSCYFITPNFHGNANAGASDGASEDGSEERDAIIGDLTEFVLSSTAATMGAWLQMIENILVVEQAGAAPPPR